MKRIDAGIIAARVAIALVWLYNGLWSKVLGGSAHHASVVSAVPGFEGGFGGWVLVTIGIIETALALWVLAGYRPRVGAIAQTALLAAVNTGGLLWAREEIPDPINMIVQNLAFIVLIWFLAEREERRWEERRDG
jgi:uncharacterized membrane protein YphA (DoxX/SURF4 family)